MSEIETDEQRERRNRNAAVPASPRVRVLANRLGVELSEVTATGAGGRISTQDVRAHANRGRAAPAAAPYAPPAAHTAGAGRFAAPVVSQLSTWAQGSSGARMTGEARRRSPEPTLFGSGDLPPFTASGIPPEALLQVPWQARHAMASATTPAEAWRVLDDFSRLSSVEDAEAVAASMYGGHRGNREYAARVEHWLLNGRSEAEVMADRQGRGITNSAQVDENAYAAFAAQLGLADVTGRKEGIR